MPTPPAPLNLQRLKVQPLASRRSMARIEDILVRPDAPPPPLPNAFLRDTVALCTRQVRAARARGASVMLLYGAHLVKNGANAIVTDLLAGGWVTHLATNGAGSIRDPFAGIGKPEPRNDLTYEAGHIAAIADLIECIGTDKQPRCSAADSRAIVEMIAAIFESHRIGGPVELPLKTRANPLTLLS